MTVTVISMVPSVYTVCRMRGQVPALRVLQSRYLHKVNNRGREGKRRQGEAGQEYAIVAVT